MTDDERHCREGSCDNQANRGEAESEAVSPEMEIVDADLAQVVAAWPILPADVKRAIVQTVKHCWK